MHPLNRHLGLNLRSVAMLAACIGLWGQQTKPAPNPQQAEDSGAIFRADTRVVDLHATVVDKSSHLITNLPRESFTVYENGVQQMIRSFKREDVPVSMG